MNVLKFGCVGKGTSSCEEIVKAKMAEIRRICDKPRTHSLRAAQE